jgi:hypothetical protein
VAPTLQRRQLRKGRGSPPRILGSAVSKILKPIGATQHTCQIILLFLETIGRPARTSEIRQAITRVSPESAVPVYGCLGELLTAGRLERLSTERDALIGVRQ